MRGSFDKRNWRVEQIIRESQAEWEKGYEVGKSGKTPNVSYVTGRSAAFTDGFLRGEADRKGVKQVTLPAPPRWSEEQMATEQHGRGYHLGLRDAERGEDIPSHILEKCHPAFVRGYRKGHKSFDWWDHGDDLDPPTREEEEAADEAAQRILDGPEY